MSRLNVTLSRRLPLHCLITLFYGVLDPGRHTLTYANAGHTLPFIMGSQGATELGKGGPPLGVWEEREYGSRDVSMEQGDSLVMYSDGISEAFNAGGEEFGAQRLMALAGRLRSASPDEMVRGILGELVPNIFRGPSGGNRHMGLSVDLFAPDPFGAFDHSQRQPRFEHRVRSGGHAHASRNPGVQYAGHFHEVSARPSTLHGPAPDGR